MLKKCWWTTKTTSVSFAADVDEAVVEPAVDVAAAFVVVVFVVVVVVVVYVVLPNPFPSLYVSALKAAAPGFES